MNEQRFVDEVLAHMRKQGVPCIKKEVSGKGVGSICRYDGPNDMGCAFRPAIMTLDPKMEGAGADEYPLDNLHPWARELDRDLVGDVQNAHDSSCRLEGAEFLTAFEEKMIIAVSSYNRANDRVETIHYRPPA